MTYSFSPLKIRLFCLSLCLLFLVGCNQTEEVAEPTPRPVEIATEEVPPTATPEPTHTPEPAEPPPTAAPTEVPDPTIDPENDGTLLKAPIMQEEPIAVEFSDIDNQLIASGIGPIAPASSISFVFDGFPGQTFQASIEGGTFGQALLLNGSVIPVASIQGRASVWELAQPGQYEYTISNGGPGSNYLYNFNLTKPADETVPLPPQSLFFGQGMTELTVSGDVTGTEPIVYIFEGFEGQNFNLSINSSSSQVTFINLDSGEQFESAVGSDSLDIPTLPNNGEYRIEVSADSAEPFELTITLQIGRASCRERV